MAQGFVPETGGHAEDSSSHKRTGKHGLTCRRADQSDWLREDLFQLALRGCNTEVDHTKVRRLIYVSVTDPAWYGGIAEDAGRVVGYIAGFRSEALLFHGEQFQVVGWYGQGGQKLLEMAAGWAGSLGIQRIILTVNPGKRYDRWAEKQGMQTIRSYMKE